MKSLNMPGLSIAIINNGEVVYHRTKEYSVLEEKKEITKNN